MKVNKPNTTILITSFTSGGAEKVISLFLTKMVKDFTVKLVLFYNEIHFPIPDEVETILLTDKKASKNIFQKVRDLISFYRSYKKILITHDIRYSLSFLAFPNLLNGLVSTKNRAFKSLISERGFPSDNTTSKVSKLVAKLFYPIYYNKCDRLFSNSIFINQDLKKHFSVSIPMEVIYNPILIPKEGKNPSRLLKNFNESIRLITIGSLEKRKNQELVLKALNTLKDPTITFEIYGEGPLEEFLKHQISILGLINQVFLKGKTKQVNEKLLNADIFVLSSFTEGFPNALLEAMAMGLPCIATNCLSGPLELLHKGKLIAPESGTFFKADFGILINNNDQIALAKAINYFIEHPEERVRYSALSLERARTYELDAVYSKLKEFILKD